MRLVFHHAFYVFIFTFLLQIFLAIFCNSQSVNTEFKVPIAYFHESKMRDLQCSSSSSSQHKHHSINDIHKTITRRIPRLSRGGHGHLSKETVLSASSGGIPGNLSCPLRYETSWELLSLPLLVEEGWEASLSDLGSIFMLD